ncbi:helix-turn-helix domain-containing protein [Streptomyces sp. NPDC057654]|uniref:helix-turn-helix domain-containing protein n=1 Tax=Streptomyces sp. NPDC057654 TaxID=3346196 RepID=UPI00368C7D5E
MYGRLSPERSGWGREVAMQAHARPTVRRKRLGSELRRLREAAAVSLQTAGQHIDGDKTKMSRIENGRQNIRPLELKALLTYYQVKDEALVAALLALHRQSKQAGWWQQYGDALKPDFQERLTLEADAVRLGAFQTMVVPGLLQTEDYAEAVMRGAGSSASTDQIAELVRLRMERQAVFERAEPPQYICILDEAVLHRRVGGRKVMIAQLRKLIELNERPLLSIQIVEYEQGSYAGIDGSFTLYTYPDPMELDIVGLDYLDGALYLEDDAPVERYRTAFDQLRAVALSSRQTIDLISRIIRDLETH